LDAVKIDIHPADLDLQGLCLIVHFHDSYFHMVLAALRKQPGQLKDARVVVEEADIATVITANPRTFDAVLLDVDNGPAAFTTTGNRRLYGTQGLADIRRCLRPRGMLGVWSADPDQPFARRLTKAGFRVRTETVSARLNAKGPKHTIFVAKKP